MVSWYVLVWRYKEPKDLDRTWSVGSLLTSIIVLVCLAQPLVYDKRSGAQTLTSWSAHLLDLRAQTHGLKGFPQGSTVPCRNDKRAIGHRRCNNRSHDHELYANYVEVRWKQNNGRERQLVQRITEVAAKRKISLE